jgi:hypothetical protein
MSSLLEVLHQNSISMRDPDAISQELDTIVRQSEDSERVVREMEPCCGQRCRLERACRRPAGLPRRSRTSGDRDVRQKEKRR